MKIEIKKSFEKDVLRISNKELAASLFEVIKNIENCQNLSDIHHIKKMSGKGNYYRIRIGDHRLGFKVSEQTILLLRFMNRKDIYKCFP